MKLNIPLLACVATVFSAASVAAMQNSGIPVSKDPNAAQKRTDDSSAERQATSDNDQMALKLRFDKAEAKARDMAKSLRDLRLLDADSGKLSQQLKSQVNEIFKLRQQLRRAEIEAARQRLKFIEETLDHQEENQSVIVNQYFAKLRYSRIDKVYEIDDLTEDEDSESKRLTANAASKESVREKAIVLVDKGIQEVEVELLDAEHRLSAFRRAHPEAATSKPGKENSYQKRIAALEAKSSELAIESTVVSSQLRALERIAKEGGDQIESRVKAVLGEQLIDKDGDLKKNTAGLQQREEHISTQMMALKARQKAEQTMATKIVGQSLQYEAMQREVERKERLFEQLQTRRAEMEYGEFARPKTDADGWTTVRSRVGADSTKAASTKELMVVISDLKTNVIKGLEKHQEDYREFRKNSPLLFVGEHGKNPHLLRLAAVEKMRTEKLLEITELEVHLKSIQTDRKKTPEAVLRRLVESNELFEKLPKDKESVEKLIDQYADSASSRLTELQNVVEKLTQQFDKEEAKAKVLAEFELEDRGYRNGISKKQKLYDTLVDKLELIDMQNEYDSSKNRELRSNDRK